MISLYWHFHPRFQFFKTVKPNSVFLDVGSGDGGLAFWKEWLTPERADIKMYGIDFKNGRYKENYVKWFSGNLEEDGFPFQDVSFDVIYMSHLLEHINNPVAMLSALYKHLSVNGLIYVEIPHENTINLPKKAIFTKNGFNTSTINFYDDPTHIKTYNEDTLQDLFSQIGFIKINSGVIYNPYLEECLLSTAYFTGDSELATYALWNALKWARFMIFEKK